MEKWYAIMFLTFLAIFQHTNFTSFDRYNKIIILPLFSSQELSFENKNYSIIFRKTFKNSTYSPVCTRKSSPCAKRRPICTHKLLCRKSENAVFLSKTNKKSLHFWDPVSIFASFPRRCVATARTCSSGPCPGTSAEICSISMAGWIYHSDIHFMVCTVRDIIINLTIISDTKKRRLELKILKKVEVSKP